MDTIFLNCKNSKTSDPHRVLLNLTDRINLKRSDESVALSNLSITVHEKKKKSYNNNKFKTWAPKWDKKLELPEESYSVLDIPDCCEYILKKRGENTDNPSIWIYVKK